MPQMARRISTGIALLISKAEPLCSLDWLHRGLFLLFVKNIFDWSKGDAFHSELAHRTNPNIASIHEFSVHEFFFYLHVFTFYPSNRSAMLASKANCKFFFFSASQAFKQTFFAHIIPFSPVRSLRLHRGFLLSPNHKALIIYAILKDFFEVFELCRIFSTCISVNNAIVIITYNFQDLLAGTVSNFPITV